MHPVVIEREADHNRVHSKNPLEVADDRDRATLPNRDRFLAPLGGKRGAGFDERRVVEGKLRCRGAGETLKLNPASAGRRVRTNAWKAARIFCGSCAPTSRNDTFAMASAGITVFA